MKTELAIIIPAYKSRFLRDTLDSIAKQSNKEFTVYIGDDASPDNITDIISDYNEKLNVVYHRFDNNLGGKDLPGHWDRCIALSNEPLIWLFSDDDLMPSDAVERVLKTFQKYDKQSVCMRFPLMIVDEHGKMKYQNPPFESERITGYDLLLDKLSGKISSAACEYIFSREVWKQTGGFIKFPLAWCSDDATWATFADKAGGIISLPGNSVGWRNAEGANISNSTSFDKEKLRAVILFLHWIGMHYASHLKEHKLHKALEAYIHTILCCSIRRNFSLSDLMRVCSSLGRFDVFLALRVACSHITKINLIIKK